MEISTTLGSITDVPSDALIVNLFEGVKAPGGATGAVDSALGGIISDMIRDGEIKGKYGQTALVHTQGRIAAARVLIVGLGKAEEFDLIAARRAAGVAIRRLKDKGIREVTSIVHGAGIGGMDPRNAARATVEGTMIGALDPDLYKTQNREDITRIERFTVVERDTCKLEDIRSGDEEGRILGEATNLARDLANEPANRMTPPDPV